VLRYVYAVDIGGTKVELAVGDETGRLLKTDRVPTPALGRGDAIVDALADRLSALTPEGVRPDAVGVGSPGPLDSQAGRLLKPSNLPGWEYLEIEKKLGNRLGLRVVLENDATAAALGEWRYGAGRGVDNLVYVTVSTGIGAGIIAHGDLIRGVGANAGELGHVVVNPGGVQCHCGLRGCLETEASGTAMARMAQERREESGWFSAHAGPITAADVFSALDAGDRVAADIVAHAADRLAWAFGMLVNLMNPERIVVGGGVATAGDRLLAPIRDAMPGYAMADLLARATVVPAALGADVGVAGALAVAISAADRG
jgi:glucokinase